VIKQSPTYNVKKSQHQNGNNNGYILI